MLIVLSAQHIWNFDALFQHNMLKKSANYELKFNVIKNYCVLALNKKLIWDDEKKIDVSKLFIIITAIIEVLLF